MTNPKIKQHYKTVIIGAGPAGLSAALNLLLCGQTDVLVVEKSEFPRYKCCAGYVTEKTKKQYEKLGLSLDECHYSKVENFDIFYKFRKKLTIDNEFLYTNRNVDRVELDNAFFETAKSTGVEIACNTSIKNHSPDKSTIELTSGDCIKYDTLIFADGTASFGSKYQKNKKKNIALQLIVKGNAPDSISIHFGNTKHGYGWQSVRNQTVNIGLTDVYDPNIDYRKVFADFAATLGLKADMSALTGAFTPIGTRKPILFRNVFFVGDAVGACDPLTLSGLRYALKSGEMCAKAIATNKSNVYKSYIRKLKIKFGFSSVFMKLFYFKPILSFGLNVFCKYCGKITSVIFNKLFVNKK